MVSDNGSDCEGNDGADIGPRDPVVDYAYDAENVADAAADDEEIEELVPFLCTPYEIPPMENQVLRRDSPGYTQRRKYPEYEINRRQPLCPRNIPIGLYSSWGYVQLFCGQMTCWINLLNKVTVTQKL